MSDTAVEAPGATLVWLADTAALTDARLAHYASWLGESERQRHGRFLRAERRRQFVAGRALLRMALGRLLAVEPTSIVIDERPGKAPQFRHPLAPRCGFSISHTGRWVACAASTATTLGLDIERIDSARDVLALAEQAFPPETVEQLRLLKEQERITLFYRLWCLHEAAIKLGTKSVASYVFEHANVAGALRCAMPLIKAPVMVKVAL